MSPGAAGPGLALTASREASGALWLHALLAGDPKLDLDARARTAAGLVLQLAWLPSAAPRVCPLVPGLVLAAELAERTVPTVAVHVRFAEAFRARRLAPHLPCFVQLGCRDLAPVTLALDPAGVAALPELEGRLGLTSTDALLRAELGPARADPERRLRELERALQDRALRERTTDAPLAEAAAVACALADAGHQPGVRRGKAAAWAHELLDRLDAHRAALAARAGKASGPGAALLQARIRAHEQTWRGLTGGDPRLAGLFASGEGRSLIARRLPG